MPHKITMITRPLAGFEVPSSEGHQLYSAILGILRDTEAGQNSSGSSLPLDGYGIPVLASRPSLTSFSLCPLQGRFKRSLSPKRKELDPGERYGLALGITDPREVDVFHSALQPLLSRKKNLRLKKGELRVEELAGSSASFQDLMQALQGCKDLCIDFEFKSVTIIPYRNSKMFEMFPHREAVFHSLLAKWNAVCPEDLRIGLERDDLRRYISERPMAYETKSAVINTVYDRVRAQARPIIRLGFVGSIRYAFSRDAPEELRRQVCALARFAEYSGVGSSVGHGCGAVAVRIEEGKE